MARGIIYIMTTVVPGLIKIGKTGSESYKSRMYNLEHNGYCNVTGLKRVFAIEVEDYDKKEAMLHTIFEKSQVKDTELFALDVNIAKQLLSSFEGKIIYPEVKPIVEAVPPIPTSVSNPGHSNGKNKPTNLVIIPDGTYTLVQRKKSDNRMIHATAIVKDGSFRLLKGSVVGVKEDAGCSEKAKELRKKMKIDDNGQLLEDIELGVCWPSFAGSIVMNASINGWEAWKNSDGISIKIYREED